MFKKVAIPTSLSLMLAAGIVMTNHSSAEAGQYYRWGSNGYTNNYTDFTFRDSYGGSYSGTIWDY
jgi:hypothetical protein